MHFNVFLSFLALRNIASDFCKISTILTFNWISEDFHEFSEIIIRFLNFWQFSYIFRNLCGFKRYFQNFSTILESFTFMNIFLAFKKKFRWALEVFHKFNKKTIYFKDYFLKTIIFLRNSVHFWKNFFYFLMSRVFLPLSRKFVQIPLDFNTFSSIFAASGKIPLYFFKISRIFSFKSFSKQLFASLIFG